MAFRKALWGWLFWPHAGPSATKAAPFAAKPSGRGKNPYGAPSLRTERRNADTRRIFPLRTSQTVTTAATAEPITFRPNCCVDYRTLSGNELGQFVTQVRAAVIDNQARPPGIGTHPQTQYWPKDTYRRKRQPTEAA